MFANKVRHRASYLGRKKKALWANKKELAFIKSLIYTRVKERLEVQAIKQGWPDFFSGGPNFIKILYCGPQNFFLPYFFYIKIT